MPLTMLECRDGKKIKIEDCLKPGGCRMKERCAPVPYLRAISFDREFKGVTPSGAGNGPRLIFLKAKFPYSSSPDKRAFALHGTSVHGKLSLHHYTKNVLSEEPLKDHLIEGIPDLLEEDENDPGFYILTDYKTFGSYKVAVKCMGLYKTSRDEPVLDEEGNQIIFKSGKRKGQAKTKKVYSTEYRADQVDMKSEELQLNRYRILFNREGFKIKKIRLFCIVRDGGLYSSKQRGLVHNTYIIDLKILPDEEVLGFYEKLMDEVNQAFKEKWARICNEWESWEGRRCSSYCEVKEHCDVMKLTSRKKNWLPYYNNNSIG